MPQRLRARPALGQAPCLLPSLAVRDPAPVLSFAKTGYNNIVHMDYFWDKARSGARRGVLRASGRPMTYYRP